MKLNIRSYIQFLAWMKHYWALYPWLNLLNLLLGVFGVALSLCFVYLFKAAIDIATEANPGPGFNFGMLCGRNDIAARHNFCRDLDEHHFVHQNRERYANIGLQQIDVCRLASVAKLS